MPKKTLEIAYKIGKQDIFLIFFIVINLKLNADSTQHNRGGELAEVFYCFWSSRGKYPCRQIRYNAPFMLLLRCHQNIPKPRIGV